MHLASCSEDRVYLWDVATGCQLDSAGPPLDIRHEPAGIIYVPPRSAACLTTKAWFMCRMSLRIRQCLKR